MGVVGRCLCSSPDAHFSLCRQFTSSLNRNTIKMSLGVEMEHYTEVPTVVASANFDPVADAQGLRAAMKGLGTSEQEIIDILCYRSNAQRQLINQAYTSEFGREEEGNRDLMEDLKSELGGHFESVIVGLMMPTANFCAKKLNKAMKGGGTDEETLVEILCSRTAEEIKHIANAYLSDYDRTLEDDIKDDTSGPLQRLLILAIEGVKNERMYNTEKAAEQAALLYQAGEAKIGTDEDTFVEILAHAGQRQAYLIFEEYKKIAGRTIEQAMQDEMDGELLTGLLALVKTAANRPQYFAERLNAAMEGCGTDDSVLINTIVGRCEIDLANIKYEYERLYGKTLLSSITSECSGDYRTALAALVGPA